MKLTNKSCGEAPPGRYRDTELSGFGLDVGKSGSRSFFVEYRPGHGRGSTQRKMVIGALGEFTVTEARKLAKKELGDVARGIDPLERREAAKRTATHNTETVIEDWLERDQKRNRSYDEVARTIRKDVVPALRGRPIAEIRRRDIVKIIDKIADRGSKVMADRTLAHIRRLFQWAIERDIIEIDPTAGIGKLAGAQRRERVLSNEEIIAVWSATKSISGPYGAGVRLLFLTAARLREVFEATWDEVDEHGHTLHLSGSRVKRIKGSQKNQGREIHLTTPAWDIVQSMPKFGDYIFTTNGKAPFSGFSKAKDKLVSCSGVEDWNVHDIRATIATNMQRLGVRLEVTETVLGHLSGSRSGVVGIYQQHEFRDEARDALIMWSDELMGLLGEHR